jgi:hypothetical protein
MRSTGQTKPFLLAAQYPSKLNRGGMMAIQKKAMLAKLTRPTLHGAVLRERLFARLEEKWGQTP